ncbi:type II CAAX endopeptidase family protein [Lysobacter sp. M2-1]|jgi:membrane protease YdiL (CAAX protease family)|uniref:CPBP family intramembrane glutamic endopeptidase n=1 Tax=Lysobacter sp. M2-1 TaxID=2916839 RepID=UPI001F5872A2|nr:type II CAAX endopeptidase family protein [Lysobacter sp. M2-1]
MEISAVSAHALRDEKRPFPMASLVWFVVGAVVLRMLAIPAWMFFPERGVLAHSARVLIPLLVVIGLIALNRTFLMRDGFPRDTLGLGLRRIGWFFAGAMLIVPVILAMAGALWLLVPFHWERGAMAWSQLGWKTAEYFAGNFGEELAFRGYMLVVLTRYLGLTRALLIGAVLFGLFHLPGLSGMQAVKMVCTTGAMSFVFAYGYVLSGSLWTAVGLHVFGNVLLHEVLGMSGKSGIATMVFHEPWPSAYDPAFLVWLGVSIPVAVTGALLVKRFGMKIRGNADGGN